MIASTCDAVFFHIDLKIYVYSNPTDPKFKPPTLNILWQRWQEIFLLHTVWFRQNAQKIQ
jgi:hypothetical protein